MAKSVKAKARRKSRKNALGAARSTGCPISLAMLLRAEPTMRDGRDGAPRARARDAAKRAAIAQAS